MCAQTQSNLICSAAIQLCTHWIHAPQTEAPQWLAAHPAPGQNRILATGAQASFIPRSHATQLSSHHGRAKRGYRGRVLGADFCFEGGPSLSPNFGLSPLSNYCIGDDRGWVGGMHIITAFAVPHCGTNDSRFPSLKCPSSKSAGVHTNIMDSSFINQIEQDIHNHTYFNPNPHLPPLQQAPLSKPLSLSSPAHTGGRRSTHHPPPTPGH